jgi:tetratricopeptide (TPR) repeat protein
VLPVLPLLAGVLAWLGIFSTGFAQDDFHWLLRATEGGPPAWTAPRVLSMSLYFRAAHALFGLNVWPYHAVSLLLHLATGVLLYRVLARRLSAGIAAVAAAWVLASPALFDALHWVSGIADLLCAAWLALTVWLLTGDDDAHLRRWLSLATYALALASKEIAVGALPVLMVLHVHRGGRTPELRGELRGVLRAVLCAVLAVAFAVAAAGAWQTTAGGAYAWKPAALLVNLPAFATTALASGLAFREPSDLAWARQAWVVASGGLILAAWLLALIVRRSRAAWLAALWFLGLLAPVALLEHQFQFYYLCCALPGFAASLAFLAAGLSPAALRRLGGLALGLVVAQLLAIEARTGARLERAPLPVDFVLRRALVAGNALGDLEPARELLTSRLVMLGQQPVDAAWQGRSTTEATDYSRDPWRDENVRAALSNGEAIRLHFPALLEVVFKPWLDAEDTHSVIAGFRIDGHLTVADYRTFVGAPRAAATVPERLERAGDLIRRRLFREAYAELNATLMLAPDDPDVLINLGALEVQLGDSTTALSTLARAVQVSPDNRDARYNLGLLQWRLGRRDEAEATWSRLLAEAPESDLARAVRDLLSGRAR